MSARIRKGVTLFAGILVLAAVACGSSDKPEASPQQSAPAPTSASGTVAPAPSPLPPARTPPSAAPAGSLPSSFADVVERVRPAVVGLSVRAQVINPFTGRPTTTVQTGTGVIVTPQGFIVTNQHVIAEGTRIEVTTDDEKTYIAEVVGQDANADLAVIKITGQSPFPYLSFAAPDAYRVGDWVIAIGNALGLPGGPTVTIGVISALDRSISVDDTVMGDLVQTDAVINQGNSGGPLVNLNGEIVGINTITAGESRTTGYGFAISSFTAQPVTTALMQFGRITWAWLGVALDELSPSTAMQYDLSVRQGVFVNGIIRNGPAHVAGIQPGDVLVKVGQTQIRRVRDIDVLMREQYKPGDKAAVTILRGGAEQTIQVTFAEQPRR